tara:strand:- start:27957 stop:28265 length:309 start_codon:yes stop_codon:yes gene_type:complete
MKKYNTEEYFSVIETKTGRKILDCGNEQDALAMVTFDPQNRTITRNKFLMGPVIDLQMPKALPTTNIVVSYVKENGCATRYEQLEDAGQLKLPERQQEPFII